MSRKIVLCTPRKSADLEPFKEARKAFIAACPEGVDLIDFDIKSGLVKSRDTACSYALHVDAADVLMWDNDVSAEPEAVWRMLSHDVDIVGAPYTTKEHPSRWVFTALKNATPAGLDGLWEVYEMGTGLKRYRVSALREIVERFPQIEYEGMDGNLPDVRRFNLHYMGVVPQQPPKKGRWLSEDFGFDHLARGCGLKIWCDLKCKAKHWQPGLTAYPIEEPSLVPDLVVEANKSPGHAWT